MSIFYRLAELILSIFPPKNTETIREKQMLMHPGKSGSELTRDYYIKKTGYAAAIIVVGILLSVMILISDMRKPAVISDNLVRRNGYGEGDRVIHLDVYTDGKLHEKEKPVTVAEKEYTEAEIIPIFQEIGSELETRILGENTSTDHVDHDLSLPDEDDVYPVSIEWLIDDHDVLDIRGHIRDGFNDTSGRRVRLVATLSYGSLSRDFPLYVTVYPEYLAPEDRLSHDIDIAISDEAQASLNQSDQILPSTVDGHSISYKNSLPHHWFYILIISLLSAALIYAGKDKDLSREVEKREREMLIDYPEIVSKLTLLIGAGMTVRAAFEKVALDHKKRNGSRRSFAGEEMLITVHRMKSGISESEAYLDFGKRCAVKRYTKLGALLSQNIRKGSSGMLAELEREVREAFEERKAIARKAGEAAGTKLLLPMILMLSVVMLIIIVPAFMSFGM
jgi:hypothetical protein